MAIRLRILQKNLNMDPENLKKTVATWNEAVENHDDKRIPSGQQEWIVELLSQDSSQFILHLQFTTLWVVFILIQKTQVLDGNGDVIKGLYAAGEVAGGLHGNNRVGGNSIAETIVFGRQAGQQVTVYARGLK